MKLLNARVAAGTRIDVARTWRHYEVESWPEALQQMRETAAAKVTDYLVGAPLPGDYLEEGAAAPGPSHEDFEQR